MDFSLLMGGLRYGTQKFDRNQAATHGNMLVLAMVALAMPSLFNHTTSGSSLTPYTTETIIIDVALVMIILYILWLFYSFGSNDFSLPSETSHEPYHW